MKSPLHRLRGVLILLFASAPAYLIARADTPPQVQWQRSFGGTNSDFLNCLRQTSDGGYILGGYSSSGINGSKTSTNYGVQDLWIIKLDTTGNKVWEKTFGGTNSDYAY